MVGQNIPSYCRWKLSHLHRPNKVACRDRRRKDIKPICDTKNDFEREEVAASRKSVKNWNWIIVKKNTGADAGALADET